MEERFLYHIWDAGHLLTPLRTASGKTLQVRYQGQFNTGRGPDFRNVVLDIDGQTLRGDIEIHLVPQDWVAHDHHEDPYYNQVILHVVLNPGQLRQTIKENGETVEILVLRDQLSEEIRKLLDEPHPVPSGEGSTYCDLLSAVDMDTLAAILTKSGLERFGRKTQRFNAALLTADFDQVFYEGLMESLGYEKNKHNMLALAQAIPLQQIRQWRWEGLTPLELVAIIVCSSGLRERCHRLITPQLDSLLRDSYESQRFWARRINIDWQLFRLRPASHPFYRLVAMCGVLLGQPAEGLLKDFLDRCLYPASNSRDAFKAFSRRFREITIPGAESFPRIGAGLCANMFVNILLPMGRLYHEKHADMENLNRIRSLYLEFPGLQENHILRHMARYLSASQYRVVMGKAIWQQGLIELFHRYCHYRLCAECKLNIAGESS